MQSRLRSCAMTLPGVTEKVILDRITFAVRGRTFATEGWPQEGWAVVKLAIPDQTRLTAALAIKPEPERGAAGVTLVRLQGIDDDLLTEVLTAAWRVAYGQTKDAGRSADAAAPSPGAGAGPTR